jgi:hypothetical protein
VFADAHFFAKSITVRRYRRSVHRFRKKIEESLSSNRVTNEISPLIEHLKFRGDQTPQPKIDDIYRANEKRLPLVTSVRWLWQVSFHRRRRHHTISSVIRAWVVLWTSS